METLDRPAGGPVETCAALPTRRTRRWIAYSMRGEPGMFPAVRQRGEGRQHARDDPIAALAGEAEHLERGDVDVARQRLAQQRPGAEQPRAHGRGGDAEALGRFERRSSPRRRASRTPFGRPPAARQFGAPAPSDLGAQRRRRWRFGLPLHCLDEVTLVTAGARREVHHRPFPLVPPQAHRALD